MAIVSSHLCEDYETACGRSCVSPSEISDLNIEHDKDAVAELQEFLNEQGFDVGLADGIYGSKSASALAAFREANAILGAGFTIKVQLEIRAWD
jgi:hypothetical protein